MYEQIIMKKHWMRWLIYRVNGFPLKCWYDNKAKRLKTNKRWTANMMMEMICHTHIPCWWNRWWKICCSWVSSVQQPHSNTKGSYHPCCTVSFQEGFGGTQYTFRADTQILQWRGKNLSRFSALVMGTGWLFLLLDCIANDGEVKMYDSLYTQF